MTNYEVQNKNALHTHIAYCGLVLYKFISTLERSD